MKIIVVGFGFMGMTHTINILKNPLLELVGIVDKYPEKIMQKLSEETGNFSTGSIDVDIMKNIRIYTSLEECLATEHPDACVIAVHTDLHYKLARTALEAGVAVFLEKPFTLDPEEGKDLIRLADQQGLVLMIGHVVRFMPAYQTLREWIGDKRFGELKFLSLSRFSGVPAWGEWKDKRKSFGSSGGALFDLLIHDIDYAQWVLGLPDKIVASAIPGQLSLYDYVNAGWVYESGLQVKIEGGNIFHTQFPFRAEFVARFEQATVSLLVNDSGNIRISRDEETVLFPSGDANLGFSGELDYFVTCVSEGRRPDICTPESALQTIELCYRHINQD